MTASKFIREATDAERTRVAENAGLASQHEQRAIYLRDLLERLVQQTAIEFPEIDAGDGPGHGHEQPGIWLATGTPCEYCALWAEAKKAAKGL